MLFDIELIRRVYQRINEMMPHIQQMVGRPLTLTEKILYAHLTDMQTLQTVKKSSYAFFHPDRVAMQDATAQMALLQFMSSGRKKTAACSTVHCDHLILAEVGAEKDLAKSKQDSAEVYAFLSSVSQKYGIGFWRPGSGIIHQVLLENYAFPGGMMIGTDSHTPNAGGLGMLAIGVGGADAVDVMAGMPWELQMPKTIGVHLTGALSGWTSAKDVILAVADILTVKGGTGYVIEYFGEGASSISCTGKGTICNMGAEVGATTSIFPYDHRMAEYLMVTGRKEVAQLANNVQKHLQPDEEVVRRPDSFYDQVIEIDLSQLEPRVNGPYSPDKSWKISELANAVSQHGYPDRIHVSLIGSCTNSSYEDIERAASIAKQARQLGLRARCPLTVTPGSEQIHATIVRDGQLEALEAIGGLVLANACGPCIGQWKRSDVAFGEKNTIITSYNRNFSGRNDANPGTHSFVASPEVVIAFALAGRLSCNPLVDGVTNAEGKVVHLQPPSGREFPEEGFVVDTTGYQEPAVSGESIEVIIDPNSERLQRLQPFEEWDGKDFIDLPVLVKAQGKCTTDHISPAGKWLRYRGHLDKISDNLFSGAVNVYREEIGKGKNQLTGELDAFSAVARYYKAHALNWVAIGDENYGEGSSREHAAMEPRFLGGRVIIAKSFARIHETNLKKQGLLALTFQNASDYDRILEDDRLSFMHLDKLAPNKPVEMRVTHQDGSQDVIMLAHSYNKSQIGWFHAGSALNLICGKNE